MMELGLPELPPAPTIFMLVTQLVTLAFIIETLRRADAFYDDELLAFGVVSLVALASPMVLVGVFDSWAVVRTYFRVLVGITITTGVILVVGILTYGTLKKSHSLVTRAYLN